MRSTASERESRSFLRFFRSPAAGEPVWKRVRLRGLRSLTARAASRRLSAGRHIRRLPGFSSATRPVGAEWGAATTGTALAGLKVKFRQAIEAALGFVDSAISSLIGRDADEGMAIVAELDRLLLARNPDANLAFSRSPVRQSQLLDRLPIQIASWNITPPLR